MSLNALRNAVPAANKAATIISSSSRRPSAPSSPSTAPTPPSSSTSALTNPSKFPLPHHHHHLPVPQPGTPRPALVSSQPFFASPTPLSPTVVAAASFTPASPADSLALVQATPSLNQLLAQLQQLDPGSLSPKRKLIEGRHHPRTEGDGIIRQDPAPFLRQPSVKRKMPKRVVVDVYCQLEGYLEQLRPLISPIMQKKFILDEYPVAVDHLPITPKAHGAILTLYSSTDRWKERLNSTLVDRLNELYANVCLVLLKPVSDPTGLAYISSKGSFLAIKQLCVSEEGVYDIPYNRSVLEEVLHLFERDDAEDPMA